MPSTTCRSYCCSSFATFQDQHVSKLPDLKNPIHPVFRRDNFLCNSDEDYELLEQPLRLASLIIESDAALPFTLRTFDGCLQVGEDGETRPLSQLYFEEMIAPDWCSLWDEHLVSRPDQLEPNAQTRERVAQLLTGMADLASFDLRDPCEVFDDEDPEKEATNLMGCTDLKEGPLTFATQQLFPRGCQTHIWLARDEIRVMRMMKWRLHWYRKLGVTSADYEHGLYHFHFLNAAFQFAITLVHELAHAEWKASVGPCEEKPHRHAIHPEQGFELIKEVFGGLVHFRSIEDALHLSCRQKECNRDESPPAVHAAGVKFVALLEDWPNMLQLEPYVGAGLRCPEFKAIPCAETFARIPLTYVQDIFSADFWKKVHVDGSDALKPPIVGTWDFDYKALTKTYSRCSTIGTRTPFSTNPSTCRNQTTSSAATQCFSDTRQDSKMRQILGKRKRQGSHKHYQEEPVTRDVERLIPGDSRLDESFGSTKKIKCGENYDRYKDIVRMILCAAAAALWVFLILSLIEGAIEDGILHPKAMKPILQSIARSHCSLQVWLHESNLPVCFPVYCKDDLVGL